MSHKTEEKRDICVKDVFFLVVFGYVCDLLTFVFVGWIAAKAGIEFFVGWIPHQVRNDKLGSGG